MVTEFAVAGRVLVNGVEASCDRIALPLTVIHGRSNLRSQPDAPEATFGWVGDAPPTRGTTITVQAGPAAPPSAAAWAHPGTWWDDPVTGWNGGPTWATRFTGRVTSVTARSEQGEVRVWEIRAVGDQAQLGAAPVRIDRPAEPDTARVTAIAAAAGVPVVIAGDPGVVLAPDTIQRDALDALHQVCQSSGGLLWQTPDGRIVYGTQHHRDAPSAWLLPCTAILDGLDWTINTQDVINHVTVEWGPEDDRHQVTVQDLVSQQPPPAGWGQRHQTVSTILASDQDAQLLGALILARRAQPRWTMPGVVVASETCTPEDIATMLTLDVSEGVVLPVSTEPGPTPGPLRQWTVEGWVESWDRDGHRWQLAVSDRLASETSGLRSWAEVRDGGDWAHWAQGSWIQQLVKVEG